MMTLLEIPHIKCFLKCTGMCFHVCTFEWDPSYLEISRVDLSCRVFVGTVSEFCQKHAECPVISIKRRADETPQDPVDD
jgi:hypothetical protein